PKAVAPPPAAPKAPVPTPAAARSVTAQPPHPATPPRPPHPPQTRRSPSGPARRGLSPLVIGGVCGGVGLLAGALLILFLNSGRTPEDPSAGQKSARVATDPPPNKPAPPAEVLKGTPKEGKDLP